jgi:hypothetical protein
MFFDNATLCEDIANTTCIPTILWSPNNTDIDPPYVLYIALPFVALSSIGLYVAYRVLRRIHSETPLI